MAWRNSRIVAAAAALLALMAGVVAFCRPGVTELDQLHHAAQKLWTAQSCIEKALNTTQSTMKGRGVLVGVKESRQNARAAPTDELRMFPGKEWPGAASERAAEARARKAVPDHQRATAVLPARIGETLSSTVGALYHQVTKLLPSWASWSEELGHVERRLESLY